MMLIVFASLNHVNAVKRRLHTEGVFVEMVRTPLCFAYTGCSFALRCEAAVVAMILTAANCASVKIGGVFNEPIAKDNRFLAIGSDEEE